VLVFLLIFALTPLLTAVVINVPLVFDNLEHFYRKTHLQNLRAIFFDLDQHLDNRQELVRFLSNLPEPGILLGEAGNEREIDLARAHYTKWINQILPDRLDVVQIVFLDNLGQERFWLERDSITQEWHPTVRPPDRPPEDFILAARNLEPGRVLRSYIRLDPEPGNENHSRLMTLYLIGRVTALANNQTIPIGAVLMIIDVGGIAKFYPRTLWVNSNGSYLQTDPSKNVEAQAFKDYPGLERIFAKGMLDIWEGSNGQEILWEALFLTENSGPLWVGREIDPSPIRDFRNILVLRVFIIVLLLVALVSATAHWIAVRLERWGWELTVGIERMLKGNGVVAFNWGGPREIQSLSKGLTDLARSHAEYARELEASNKYKSEFLANMSHELRTPLNSILLLSKLLAEPDSGLSAEQIKQARVIHHAGSDLQALIDNLLDHAKIEARETDLFLEWIDARVLVEQLIELVQPQFTQKELYLNLVVFPNAPYRIRTDGEKLRQILKNFLANAVKFTETGGVEISIDSAGQSICPLRISVSDTGVGIPEDKHELIFQPFKQADGSTSRRYGGTGLGLTICRKLAHFIGGLIELESEPGVGSTFSLLLPIDPENPQPNYEFSTSKSGPCSVNMLTNNSQCTTTNFSGQCVMLVEHNIEELLTLTAILKNWGIKVTIAANQEEALENLYDGDTYSLVLLGPGISELEGCATITGIHAEPTRISLPVVVISYDYNADLGAKYKAAGVAEWLSGPLNATQLEAALQRQLDNNLTQPKDT